MDTILSSLPIAETRGLVGKFLIRGAVTGALVILHHTGLQAQPSSSISMEDGQRMCRAWQIRVERTLGLKEEYKIVSGKEAGSIRSELVDLELQCKLAPTKGVLARYAEVDRLLYDDGEDGF